MNTKSVHVDEEEPRERHNTPSFSLVCFFSVAVMVHFVMCHLLFPELEGVLKSLSRRF